MMPVKGDDLQLLSLRYASHKGREGPSGSHVVFISHTPYYVVLVYGIRKPVQLQTYVA